ncbi:YggS family pyridoxal phosphate-dependent enzyme [Desulfovibrio ferrophilus]|uniref:Pyridoxal phosphate homeostasis protein n=1 Tax=Desulfovibrio ferrophilus TaxID=241368 RepID=A0A2Z6B1Y4_9BACT|nr:YggS family pyridoxal phosphate-dependent enzyme [Desulfovibrio ferrophilus]BBD09406.1 alanine racemase [Desulfovibrio ferrophilus]
MEHNVDGQAIRDRLVETRGMIDDAAKASGRSPEDVTLVAISKLHPAQAVAEAALAGQRHFGENYIQEALAKQDELAHLDLSWHFTGKLQSNKAKFVPGRFDLLHTIDKLKLAQALHKKLSAACAPRQDVLIEVNLALESQKAGVAEQDLPELAEELLRMGSMNLTGLMLLPPFDLDPEERRPLFARLRELRDGLEVRLGMKLPVLSMGMTDDFTQAVREGASLVRVGTRIFGTRPVRT